MFQFSVVDSEVVIVVEVTRPPERVEKNCALFGGRNFYGLYLCKSDVK